MKNPDISIIIPTKNGGDKFPLALAKMFSYRGKYEFEVVVGDSGSTDGTIQAASISSSLPRMQYHEIMTG